MDLYKPIEKYVCENANHELSIADGKTLENVLSKLYFYEKIEEKISVNGRWALCGKYAISFKNYDEFNRICYAYYFPIDSLLKKCPDITTRTKNALKRAGIERVMDLIDGDRLWAWSVIDKIPGVGKKQSNIIFQAINKLKRWSHYGQTVDGIDFYDLQEGDTNAESAT